MLITFKSKSSPEILMFQEHAKSILDLLHKNSERGVITAAEAAQALAILENEVSVSRQHPAHYVEHDSHTDEHETGSVEHIRAQHVGFSARAYPLLEMLRAAKAGGDDIVWGV